MRLNAMTSLWARTALVWFAVTVCFGMVMGITQSMEIAPAHAHMGVLGWLSSAVFALIYAVARPWPEGARAPRLHWAAHTFGVAAMTISLAIVLKTGNMTYLIGTEIGAALVVLSVLAFVAMSWGRLRVEAVLPAE
jgi:hypothetical protein